MRARDRFHLRRFVRDRGRMPVGFHQQHGGAIGRQADARVLFDAPCRHSIEKLQRARDDARGDDGRHGFCGVFDPIVERQHRPPGRGPGHELQEHFGDDAQCALRADEQILQRVARDVLDTGVAEPRDPAVGQHDLEAHHIVARDAVLEAAKPAGVLRDVAANRADAK